MDFLLIDVSHVFMSQLASGSAPISMGQGGASLFFHPNCVVTEKALRKAIAHRAHNALLLVSRLRR